MKYSDALNGINNKPPLARTVIKAWSTERVSLQANFSFYLIIAICIVALYLLGHFTLNQSASMPLGLYKVTNQPIQRGSLVLLREPLKEIVAVPGDTVQWSAKGISVNGQLLKDSAVPADSPYPPYPYTTLKLAPDQYVAMGHHPLSFDARYTGPTPVSLIASTVQPFWTRK